MAQTKRTVDKKRSIAAKKGWETRRKRERYLDLEKREKLREKRSRAAKKGWKTRRIRSKSKKELEKLTRARKESSEALDELIESRKATKEALEYLKKSRAPKSVIRQQERVLKQIERSYRAASNAERKAAVLERKEKARLAKADPDATRASIKERIERQRKINRFKIPEFIAELYEEMLELDLGDVYDEGELFDIYSEG